MRVGRVIVHSPSDGCIRASPGTGRYTDGGVALGSRKPPGDPVYEHPALVLTPTPTPTNFGTTMGLDPGGVPKFVGVGVGLGVRAVR